MNARIPSSDVCRELLIDIELKAYLSRIREWLASKEGELDPDQSVYLDGAAVKVANVQSLLKRINRGNGRKFSEPHMHLADIWESVEFSDPIMTETFGRYGVKSALFEVYREQWVDHVSSVLSLDEDLIESLPRERRVASQAMSRTDELMTDNVSVASIGRAMKTSATIIRRFLDASYQAGAYFPFSKKGDIPGLLDIEIDGVSLESLIRSELGGERFADAILEYVEISRTELEKASA